MGHKLCLAWYKATIAGHTVKIKLTKESTRLCVSLELFLFYWHRRMCFDFAWFLRFNWILTFVGYLMPKLTFHNNRSGAFFTHNLGISINPLIRLHIIIYKGLLLLLLLETMAVCRLFILRIVTWSNYYLQRIIIIIVIITWNYDCMQIIYIQNSYLNLQFFRIIIINLKPYNFDRSLRGGVGNVRKDCKQSRTPISRLIDFSENFNLSHFVSQFPPTRFPLITAIGMCHFLPVHHFEWHFGRVEGQNTTYIYIYIYILEDFVYP